MEYLTVLKECKALIWFVLIYNAFWVGGMLNVFIYRIPIMIQREEENAIAQFQEQEPPHTETYNLAWPPSACPHCHSKISFLQMFPVISWILMRGKCGSCASPISIRYPLVELVCGLLISGAFIKFGLDQLWLGAGLALLSTALLCGGLIDAETKLLPDVITQALLWVGFIFNANAGWISLNEAVYAAIGTYAFFALAAWLFKRLKGIEGFGQGDIKLLASLAAWLGVQAIFVVCLGSMLLFIVYFGIFVRRREQEVPFGPFICIAATIVAWTGVHYV